MSIRTQFSLFMGLVILLGIPPAASAQNRSEQQMLAEQRLIHDEVQRLLQAVNALAEQVKTMNTTTTARLDEQTSTARKNYADQKSQIDSIVASLNTLREKIDDNRISVNRLASESDAIRKNLEIVTTLLTQTLTEIQAPVNPSTPAATGGGSGATPMQTVPSPASYLDQAYGLYTVGQYDQAIEGFQEYLKRFADSPDAVKAQFYIGESYNNTGKFKEAVAAYELVVNNAAYKDSDYVPQAYYKQGVCYEALKQPALAKKNYQLILKDFKDSPMAIMAAQRLPKVGGLLH